MIGTSFKVLYGNLAIRNSFHNIFLEIFDTEYTICTNSDMDRICLELYIVDIYRLVVLNILSTY